MPRVELHYDSGGHGYWLPENDLHIWIEADIPQETLDRWRADEERVYENHREFKRLYDQGYAEMQERPEYKAHMARLLERTS
jgi:hypothetical protein